jgi:hypothetical protein
LSHCEKSLKGTSAIPQLTSSIPQITSSLDPHKGLDFELLNYYKYFKPSELLSESNPEELIEAYVTEINQILKFWWYD